MIEWNVFCMSCSSVPPSMIPRRAAPTGLVTRPDGRWTSCWRRSPNVSRRETPQPNRCWACCSRHWCVGNEREYFCLPSTNNNCSFFHGCRFLPRHGPPPYRITNVLPMCPVLVFPMYPVRTSEPCLPWFAGIRGATIPGTTMKR